MEYGSIVMYNYDNYVDNKEINFSEQREPQFTKLTKPLSAKLIFSRKKCDHWNKLLPGKITHIIYTKIILN